MTVTKDTIISDILAMDDSTAKLFMDFCMACIGCPASRSETLEQACSVHGEDVEELVDRLNKHINA